MQKLFEIQVQILDESEKGPLSFAGCFHGHLVLIPVSCTRTKVLTRQVFIDLYLLGQRMLCFKYGI